MALITEAPKDLPTTNVLAYIPDDLLGPVPAVLQAFGKDLLVMDRPPEPGEVLEVKMLLRCKDEGRELLDNGEFKHYRKCKSLGVSVSIEPYKPEENEPPKQETDPGMLDENGQIPEDEPEDIEPDTDPGNCGLDEFNPAFSHNGSDD